MGQGVYHKIKIVKGQILSIVSMFFENSWESFECEYSFKDVEISCKEEEFLYGELFVVGFFNLCDVYGGWLNIRFGIVCIYFMESILRFLFTEDHRFVDFRWMRIDKMCILMIIDWMFVKELRFILKNLLPFLLLSFFQHVLYHFLLDVVCNLLRLKNLWHYKIIISPNRSQLI